MIDEELTERSQAPEVATDLPRPDGIDPPKAKKKKKKKKSKKEAPKAEKPKEIVKKTDRGIETVFRTTSKNHLQLSAIADRKANILISVNAILISVLVSVVLRRINQYPELLIPTIIMLIVCGVTIFFAISVVRPSVNSGKFSDQDIMDRKVNLLFFGNFYGMDYEKYRWGMREMMDDYDYLYDSLIKDIYFLGKVLAVKYKRLRTTYFVFLYGLIISIAAYLIAGYFLMQAGPQATL